MEENKENVIPEEELEVFDVNAVDMLFGDETDDVKEQGDVPDENVVVLEAPKTHGPEEALPGYNESEVA